MRVLEAAFETSKHFAIKNEDGKMRGVELLFNISLYLLIADRDIQSSKIDALTHPDEWKRKLSARIILLAIYEWDTDKVTGRELREAFELMCFLLDGAEPAQRLGCLLAELLHTAIAHRDPNALVQYRAIRDLNVHEVIHVGTCQPCSEPLRPEARPPFYYNGVSVEESRLSHSLEHYA